MIQNNNKPKPENDKKVSQFLPMVVSVLTLIVTIITAIPAFLSLNHENPEIYYSISRSEIQIPTTLDANEVNQILRDNGIPKNTISVSIINQGNGPADEVSISIEVPGKIISAWTVPAKTDTPIWVDIPEIDISHQPQKIIVPIKDLGTTKLITINIGYLSSEGGIEDVEVFSEGKPAIEVAEAAVKKVWSPWTVFRFPLIILGIGVLLAIGSSFFVVLINDPIQTEKLMKIAFEITREVAQIILLK